MIDKAFIMDNVTRIKEKYRFDACKLWDLPANFVSQYGYPFGMEKKGDVFYMLFQEWPSCFARLLAVSDDFKSVDIVLERPYLFDFCLGPDGKSVYTTEIDLVDFYAGDMIKALSNPNNRVAQYSLHGELQQILYRPADVAFFPKGLTMGTCQELVYHDYAGSKIQRIDFQGNPIGGFDTEKCFVRKLNVANNGDIFFVSTSRMGRIKLADETHEILWKMTADGTLTQIFANSDPDIKETSIFDFQILNDGCILCLLSRKILKLDTDGKPVFHIDMDDHRLDNHQLRELQFLNLTKDPEDKNTCYVLFSKKVEQTYHLYKLDI